MSKGLIPIGIPVIDDFISGLPRDSLILIIGDPGSGFDTFLHQLLVHRGNNGIPTIYTSLDRSELEVRRELDAFDWNTSKLPWYFIDLSPNAKNKKTRTIQWDQDAINVVSHNLFRKIEEYKNEHGKNGFNSCISSLTYMLIQSSSKEVLRFISEYSSIIKGTSGWHFLIMVRGVHGMDQENLFSHYSDVVLEFVMRLNTETRLYERVLGIKKLPGVDSRAFPIEYDKHGIRPITTAKIR